MIAGGLSRQRVAPVDRSGDRTVALVSIAGSIAFLVAAIASLALPVADRHGLWLPLHLALAGSATLAIVGVMPFFVAAFAAAQPVDVRVRFASLLLVGAGAIGVAAGVVLTPSWVAVAGGTLFIAGILVAGATTIGPLRGALGPSRGIVSQAYLAALASVTIGATLATLLLAGWPPVAGAWFQLKPAHAWLNLVGFVSLVIATTLLHFFPTVTGTRILASPTGRATILGVGIGGFVVPLGFASGSDTIARIGAVATLAGALALAAYVAGVWLHRARWSSDHSWHRFATGGLASAAAWFVIGIAIATGRILVMGADPLAWSLDVVAPELVIGWVGLAVVGSGTHLLPAIGPGDQPAHARQRAILGRLGEIRLVAANLGIALLLAAIPLGTEAVRTIGILLVAASFVLTAALIAAAVGIGLRARPSRR